MTDRELLERAAKVACLDIYRWLPDGKPQLTSLTHQLGRVWNPLEDDGDALRLAVKLDLLHPFGTNTPQMRIAWDWLYDNGMLPDDDYAATRRAIVRAAAAMSEDV